MRLRKSALPWLAVLLVALSVGVPAMAKGKADAALTDGGFRLVDNAFIDVDGGAPDDNIVEITPGGRVTFDYSDGRSSHNVDFDDAKPSSCTQTSGPVIPGFPIPPLPPFAVSDW